MTNKKETKGMNVIKATHIKPEDAKKVVEKLNVYLASQYVNYLNLHGMHWHVQGKCFFVLHEKTEEMYDACNAVIDEVAERILQLSGIPVRRMDDIKSQSVLKEIDIITDGEAIADEVLSTIKTLAELEREIIDLAGELGDEVTADIFTGYLTQHEKEAWMFTAYKK